MGFGGRQTCIQIPALTQTLCLTMGKMLNFSKPQALHPENGARVILVILKDCPPYMIETVRTHHHSWDFSQSHSKLGAWVWVFANRGGQRNDRNHILA